MKKYQLKNIDCVSCAAKIEDGLSKMEGVKSCSVNFANSSLLIDTDNIESVKKKIKDIEPEVELIEEEDKKILSSPNGIDLSLWKENKTAIVKIFITVLFLGTGLIFEKQIHNTPYRVLELTIFLTAYLLSGWKVIISAVKNILKGQVFNEHFLMTIATLGAF
ncbi:MAG: cation transporter, partial [Melioribacteraceae bacterium]